MTTLTNADWQRLDEFLKSLYDPCNFEFFPVQVMAALPEQIDSEIKAFFSFSFSNINILWVVSFPNAFVGTAATTFTEQSQGCIPVMQVCPPCGNRKLYIPKPLLPEREKGSWMQSLSPTLGEGFRVRVTKVGRTQSQSLQLDHPVIDSHLKNFSGEALAISDFLDESESNGQELPWTNFLNQVGIADQMGIYVDLPSTLKVMPGTDPFHQGQEQLCLMLSRDHCNFIERDHLVLNLLRPHLKQAYDTLVAFHQAHHHLAQQQAATDQAALIALSASGTVQWITQKAGEILHRYFSHSKVPMALPDLFQQWVNRHLEMFSQAEETYKLARPLKFQLEGRQLVVNFSYCSNFEQFYLLLEESEQESLSVESLQLLGLTKREAEVLFWVTKDKSLVEVGKLLGMSDRTAKKHLEHIYEKFGVQTRLSAVMYALEHLGIFS